MCHFEQDYGCESHFLHINKLKLEGNSAMPAHRGSKQQSGDLETQCSQVQAPAGSSSR